MRAVVWGPAPFFPRLGYKYYVSFVDQFIWFYWPLKLKSDVLQVFPNFLPYVERLFNTKLVTLQTDGGGEFKSLTPICQKLGIHHRFSCPHTHQ